jgi:hypothetical protein
MITWLPHTIYDSLQEERVQVGGRQSTMGQEAAWLELLMGLACMLLEQKSEAPRALLLHDSLRRPHAVLAPLAQPLAATN